MSRRRWPFLGSGGDEGGKTGSHEPKTINIFFGFFFIVNFCVGTGFLGIPYAFFYSGFFAAIPTLLIISFVSWTAALWELEVMARAQALEHFRRRQRSTAADSGSDSEREQLSDLSGVSTQLVADVEHPCYEIQVKRKFEVTELCEVFFNRWVKYFYLLIMIIYCFLAGWSFATVAGSAWATNIPIHLNSVVICQEKEFQHAILPETVTCRNMYYLCLFFFAAIVVPLSLIDLKEQAIIQMILGIMRFATIGAIILYTIAKLIEGGIPCNEGASNHPSSVTSNGHQFHGGEDNSTNASNLTGAVGNSFVDVVVKFNPKGWLAAIPVFSYAFMVHTGLASLTHPIKQKQYLHWLLVAMFGSACFCYLALGITASLWFRGSIIETATLNWVALAGPGNPPQLRALSYYLILFPSLDVSSAYPLNVHAIVNNIYIVLLGHDTSKKPKYRFDWIIRLLLKFVVAILPILAAFGISNLIYVLKYAGLFGFFICFFFPAALQLQSIRVCCRTFKPNVVSRESITYDVASSHKDETSGTEGTLGNGVEKSPLLLSQTSSSHHTVSRLPDYSIYCTPYSNRVLSHWLTAMVFGVIGVVLFLLTCVSLFIHPDTVECATPLKNASHFYSMSQEL